MDGPPTGPVYGECMEPDPGAGPARILVVDDEPAVRESLTSSLEFEGYRVAGAADGVTALDRVEQEAPTWSCWTSSCPAWTA